MRRSPITERGERPDDPLSATILLRTTAPHPDLSAVLDDEHRGAIHRKMIRDDDGRPVDALHVHGYASGDVTRQIEAAIWSALGVDAEIPASLGAVGNGARSGPLAVAQLILLYHLLMARRTHDDDSAAGRADDAVPGEDAVPASDRRITG